MHRKNEIEAQTRLSLFKQAVGEIEKQTTDRLKDNQELPRLLELIKENNILIESALNESLNGEQIQCLAKTGKELLVELEQKIKTQNRNVAALLSSEFNKIEAYYLPFLPKENPTATPSGNPFQSMSNFTAGRDIKASQVYNDHKAPTNIYYQSAVTHGTHSPAYSVPSPSLDKIPQVENILSAVRNSNDLNSNQGAAMDKPQAVKERQQQLQ
nr:hypothetical protein [Legionella sp.]